MPASATADVPSDDLVFKSFRKYDYDSDRGDRLDGKPEYDPKFKASVEAALRAGLRHPSGGFAHAESHPTAPNPGLIVEGVGAIRLPLALARGDDAHAKSLISVCQQAPFGKGERTIVDKEVRDTWQADAAQVQFTNPAWAGYIEQAVKSICVTLGVETETVTPKCELYKLLIYEEGSHFLPHVDSEKADGMFATMVVVLPSYFEGGAVHLTFNDESKAIDFGGAASAFQTSVLAWYTDVTHEVKPITAGYRLALAYNLFRPVESPSPCPVPAPVSDPSVTDLRQALALWVEAAKQGQDAKAPRALAWLLEHQYSRASMCFAALKGRDVHLVRRAQLVAAELGVCLGLAILRLQIEMPDEEEWGYESDDSEYQKHIYHYCWLKFLVDLEGKMVSDRLRLTGDLEGEMMPAEWKTRLGKVNCDDSEWERWHGNEGTGEKKWYRRTVLVMWPQGQAPFKEPRIVPPSW